MKYVQINSFYNGSTGTLMRGLHNELTEQGVDSYIFWGRRHETINDHEQCCASKLSVYHHGIMTRLFDRMGFYSKGDTKRLLEKLDSIDPDIVHLHNIHGYYINIEMLFEWLATHRCQVKWTLHDCWAFTGHCAYFTYVQCEQWRSCCSDSKPCPQLDTYPKTIAKKSCLKNFEDKKSIFTSIEPSRMTIITPSQWLADLVKQSFLKLYDVEVRHNTVDKNIFKPTPSDFKERYGVGDRFMILGVASPWSPRKGLDVFCRLVETLDSARYATVLVGITPKQAKDLPEEVIWLERTESKEELAEIYSAADLFFNPTAEDNFPTVNLEAEACGTPVLTFDTGGCRETVKRPDSMVIKCEDWSSALISERLAVRL